MAGLLELIPAVGSIIDKFVPDPNKAQEAKMEIAKLQASENVARMGVLTGMLSNQSMFVSGAIPAIIWLCPLMLLSNYVLLPWVRVFGFAVPEISYPAQYWGLLSTIIVGLFGKKVVDDNEWWIGGKLVSPSKKTIEASIRGGHAAPVGGQVQAERDLKATEKLVEEKLAAMKAELEGGK